MRTVKILDKAGVACGCEYTVDKRDQQRISKMCQEHEIEFIARHAAAVASCSHVNRDLVGS